ncbi:MAG TPA: hypothetical protein VF062_08760 [Candidatus Limnocylindrales bacterium]
MSSAAAPAADLSRRPPLRVLQMNLCNSGMAGCYTGLAVARAAAVIRAESPDLVTLNEVCEDDVSALAPAVAQAHRGGTVVPAFLAARNRNSGGVVRCVNGQPYGIGLLVHVAGPPRAHRSYGGVYPVQKSAIEQRVWLCLDTAAGYFACTTHLANGNPGVALAQCEHLLKTAIPAMWQGKQAKHTVVGGDLNLGRADALPCVPAGYKHIDDGFVQQIIATTGLVVGSSRTIDMRGATDHAGLLVAFAESVA